MRIELHNKTQFRDDDLRTIVQAACRHAGVAAEKLELHVIVSRNGGVGGRATCPRSRSALVRGYMLLKIPSLDDYCRGNDHYHPIVPLRVNVAQTALHEAMHLAGVMHSDMTEEQYHCRMPVPWADQMQLRIKEAVPVAPREERMAAARADRLEHAQAMLAKAQTRLKRATTIEKKWARRLRMLERQ